MNRKKLRRKSRSAAIYIPVAALLIILLAVLGTSAFMRVMRVEVDGASRYTEEEIITASGISSANNLLFVDAGAVSKKIYGQLPYVSEIKISRVLPDTIRIDVRESSAFASVSYQGSFLLIDSAGRVLQSVEKIPPGLIEVLGFSPVDPEAGKALKSETGDEMRFQYLTEMLSAIEKAGIRGDISYIDMSSIANISLGYVGRFKVVVGSTTNVQHKLSRLPGSVETINETNSPDETGVIDMSDLTGEWRFNKDR